LEASGAARTRRRSVDPAPLELAPDERRAFDALRAWRRARSIELGVPAFRVLTDRQLATVARAKPLDAPALATLEGIGDKRAQRCGDSLFKTLRDAEPSELGAGALRTG
jgi:ribonuclease D